MTPTEGKWWSAGLSVYPRCPHSAFSCIVNIVTRTQGGGAQRDSGDQKNAGLHPPELRVPATPSRIRSLSLNQWIFYWIISHTITIRARSHAFHISTVLKKPSCRLKSTNHRAVVVGCTYNWYVSKEVTNCHKCVW